MTKSILIKPKPLSHGKHPGGRPPIKYSKHLANIIDATTMWPKGATIAEICEVIDINIQTCYEWMQNYKEFGEAITRARSRADMIIENCLFQRAQGYAHGEDKIFNAAGEPLIVPTIKHYPPDTPALIFWLKNRQPGKWRDKIDTEVSGDVVLLVKYDQKPNNEEE